MNWCQWAFLANNVWPHSKPPTTTLSEQWSICWMAFLLVETREPTVVDRSKEHRPCKLCLPCPNLIWSDKLYSRILMLFLSFSSSSQLLLPKYTMYDYLHSAHQPTSRRFWETSAWRGRRFRWGRWWRGGRRRRANCSVPAGRGSHQ